MEIIESHPFCGIFQNSIDTADIASIPSTEFQAKPFLDLMNIHAAKLS